MDESDGAKFNKLNGLSESFTQPVKKAKNINIRSKYEIERNFFKTESFYSKDKKL